MGSTRLLSSDQINSELLEGVKDLWENSLHFDFILEVEDESIPVHKVVLAACSGYFRAMFNSNMKESSQRSVELKSLKASAVKSVVNFIYTGDIEFSADTLEDVLSAAHYLQIHSAVLLCFDYMLEDLTRESVSYVQHFSRMYGLDDVEKEIENFMLTSFSDIPDEAVESVGKQILKLTISNDFCVNSEYALFERLLSFKTILSEDDFDEALSHVRFPLMSKDELEKVSSTGVMSTRLSHLMDEAWEYHQDVMRQPLLQTERTQVRSDKVTMVLADYNAITGVYVDQEPKIIRTNTLDLERLLDDCYVHEIVSVDNFLYVCEKIHVSNGNDYFGFFRYDPRFNLWQELSPLLKTDRLWFSLVAYEKQIFAIGGYRTRNVEIYDIQTNEWRFGANINYTSLNAAGVALGGKIYVCGGEIFQEQHGPIHDEHCLDTLSCYDPGNDTWEFKAPLVEARFRHQGVVFDGKWFVFGGTNGENSLFSVEYYSPDVNQWTIIHHALPYEIDGVCSDGSDIYILKQDDKVSEAISEEMTVSFEKFNMETQTIEEEGFFIEGQRYHNFFSRKPPFIFSTLMLPFKLR